MVAGGCQVPCATDSLDLLATLVGNITAAIPGTDQYLVPYDSSPFQAKTSTPYMVAAAKQYAIDCPNTPIVFLGYSLGGIIVMNTLCGGLAYTPNVIGAIAYGEETYTYPQTYDAGTCKHNAVRHIFHAWSASAADKHLSLLTLGPTHRHAPRMLPSSDPTAMEMTLSAAMVDCTSRLTTSTPRNTTSPH